VSAQTHLDDADAAGDLVFQNQALRQQAALTGTPFTLTYEHDRQLGRTTLNSLTVPLNGPRAQHDRFRHDRVRSCGTHGDVVSRSFRRKRCHTWPPR
jgi:hypothetical protein